MNDLPASQLLWDKKTIPNFSRSEFSHTDLTLLDGAFILELQSFREKLGHSVFPSPHPDAFARLTGSYTSRHSAVDRLANAGDVFPDCHIAEAFLTALRTSFGGIGIYLDTEYKGIEWPMLHLDLRPMNEQAIWIRETINGVQKYTTFYPHRDPDVLRDIFKKLSEVE